jgi:hypothetical protein
MLLEDRMRLGDTHEANRSIKTAGTINLGLITLNRLGYLSTCLRLWLSREKRDLMPNVKDEPRRQPARRVQHNDHGSLVSFRSTIKIARDVTDVGVGSGALLGRLGEYRTSVR